jgi:alpha-methylacyl-CoA racemase
MLDGGAPFYSVYACSDGRHMAVGALEPKFYAEFVSKLGLDEDPANQQDRGGWPGLRSRIAAAFATRTQAEWTQVFAGSDACVAPVLSLREAASHPQMAARGTLFSREGVVQPAPAPRFSATPATPVTSPSSRGQHHPAEILAEWSAGKPQPARLTSSLSAHRPIGPSAHAMVLPRRAQVSYVQTLD